MSNLRMTSDLRRQLILGAAKRCFARNGFAGTTTKSVAAAAAISEGLLFKHFPSKAALYAEILAEECEADPELAHLLGQEPSTATLVELVRGMVGHFVNISNGSDQEEVQRLRFMAASHLEDGEFARLLYGKVGDLIGPTFVNSLERAIAAGDAAKDELAELPLEDDGVAVLKTRRYRQPRQGRGQNSVVREPEQVERRAADCDCIARFDRALQ